MGLLTAKKVDVLCWFISSGSNSINPRLHGHRLYGGEEELIERGLWHFRGRRLPIGWGGPRDGEAWAHYNNIICRLERAAEACSQTKFFIIFEAGSGHLELQGKSFGCQECNRRIFDSWRSEISAHFFYLCEACVSP